MHKETMGFGGTYDCRWHHCSVAITPCNYDELKLNVSFSSLIFVKRKGHFVRSSLEIPQRP